MNIQDTLAKLFALHRFGIKPGLERTLRLLEYVGNPHKSLRAIHVAGTNGKGSVCSMCASVLMEQGYRVGLYTSPHIRTFNERIQVNGQLISDERVSQYFQRMEPVIAEYEATFFEVTTVMAFMHFNYEKVDCAVVEVGMGGRFDATNVLTPIVSVITSIDLDHREYLGDSLEKIAFEKAGIIKSQVPVVIGEHRDELIEFISARADDLDAPAHIVRNTYEVDVAECSVELKSVVNLRTPSRSLNRLEIPLSGEHQFQNLATSLSALDVIKDVYPVSEQAIRAGLANLTSNTGLQARIEVYRLYPLVILDVGHNAACAATLVKTLQQSPYAGMKFNVVFGVMDDKDCADMLEELRTITLKLYATSARTQRAMDTASIASLAEHKQMKVVQCATVANAVRGALEAWDPTLITGSFYVVDEALETLMPRIN